MTARRVVGTLLFRGMLSGVVAGLLAAGFAWIVGEPQIDLAIGFGHRHLMAGQAEHELVGRAIQSTLGLLTGIVAYATALGGIFALVFAYARGRIGRLGPRGTAALLAAAGFVVLILVPQIKFPPNPPAIGDPSTIGLRTALYFGMVGLSTMLAVAAFSTGSLLVRRLGDWNGAIVGGMAYLIAVAAAMRVLPSIAPAPADFPAANLWDFRLASLGVQAVLWTALGLLFGAVAEKPPRREARGS